MRSIYNIKYKGRAQHNLLLIFDNSSYSMLFGSYLKLSSACSVATVRFNNLMELNLNRTMWFGSTAVRFGFEPVMSRKFLKRKFGVLPVKYCSNSTVLAIYCFLQYVKYSLRDKKQ